LFSGATLTNGNDFNKLNPIIRKMVTAMNKKLIDKLGKSDFRDWESINTWAEGLIKQLEK